MVCLFLIHQKQGLDNTDSILKRLDCIIKEMPIINGTNFFNVWYTLLKKIKGMYGFKDITEIEW